MSFSICPNQEEAFPQTRAEPEITMSRNHGVLRAEPKSKDEANLQTVFNSEHREFRDHPAWLQGAQMHLFPDQCPLILLVANCMQVEPFVLRYRGPNALESVLQQSGS